MEANQIRATVGNLNVFHDLPEALRGKVAEVLERIGTLRSVPRGGIWIREGEPSENRGYILLSGEAAIRKSESPEIRCQAPELLGETMQFHPTRRRTADVIAVTDAVVMRFSWDEFWTALAETCEPIDHERVREAVAQLAWSHFAG